MGWNPKTWKFDWKSGKDRWLVLLAAGLILLILAFPMDRREVVTRDGMGESLSGTSGTGSEQPAGRDFDLLEDQEDPAGSAYERQLERRLEELLRQVEGVGNVEVMIVLKSTEEKVWRVDKDTVYSSTQENDAGGGSRLVQSQEISEKTILTGQNGNGEPLLEKQLYPEISGVVVSAEGGGSPKIQAEISAAVEALFGVPSHKIKVLKRVE